jgi:adenosylcobinamide-phosphate synthase
MMAGILVTAVLLDMLMGDPRVKWHPVILMGKLIALLDSNIRTRVVRPSDQRLAGMGLVVIVLISFYGATVLLLQVANQIHNLFGMIMAVVLLYSTIAAKSLAQAGLEIYQLLVSANIDAARQKLAWIVGRDTGTLATEEIVRGTVETVAENIVDGIIAPLFYFLLGGVPLAVAYRAVNTMDSMLGYKNEKYLYFGWAAARLDDIMNFIPARITGVLLLMVTAGLGLNLNRVWRTMIRDAAGHPSPNSGIPESAVAGALGVRLGGLNYYQGIPSFRAYMGEPINPLIPVHIKQTVKMMYAVTVVFTTIGVCYLWGKI